MQIERQSKSESADLIGGYLIERPNQEDQRQSHTKEQVDRCSGITYRFDDVTFVYSERGWQ